MRIDKFLSDAGFGSRREMKLFLKQNKVYSNNILINKCKTQIIPDIDIIKVNDKVIKYKPYYYFLLNKPKGYVSANIDNIYPTILSFFNNLKIKNLTHVGRLDLDTTGAILITNDGKLNHQLINPNNNINKIYKVTLDKNINKSDLDKLINGIKLENGELTKPMKYEILTNNIVKLTLIEGKYHEVKRIFKAINYNVIELDRLSFAGLTYKDLIQGTYYELNEDEIKYLYSLIK